MNKSILEWLEEQRRLQNGTLESWKITFVTEGFFVWIKGGEESRSDPPFYADDISQYKTVVVELFDRDDSPVLKRSKEATTWEPLEIPLPSGDRITVNFDVKIFPHKPIYPKADVRFKTQPWAEKFNSSGGSGSGPWAAQAALSLDELLEVMNYLVKLDNLVAFL